MKIFIKKYNNDRILLNDNLEEIIINDGQYIQYTGYYYKCINDITNFAKIETTFIGIIECCKYHYESGINGIFVKPLYIFDQINYEWKKIINNESPKTKYFFYPHLLSLPNLNDHNNPNYFLNTCKNIIIEDFENIINEFSL